jgi:hypothetical protein
LNPDPTANEAAQILLDLTRRAANAIANNDWPAAQRWTDLAIRLRGNDHFIDHDPKNATNATPHTPQPLQQP